MTTYLMYKGNSKCYYADCKFICRWLILFSFGQLLPVYIHNQVWDIEIIDQREKQ